MNEKPRFPSRSNIAAPSVWGYLVKSWERFQTVPYTYYRTTQLSFCPLNLEPLISNLFLLPPQYAKSLSHKSYGH